MTFTFQLMLYTEHSSLILVSKWILVAINNESWKWLEVKKVLLLGIKNTFFTESPPPPRLILEAIFSYSE